MSTGHVPPENVRAAARRGLELRKKHGKGGLTTQEAGKQGIGSGVARASNLAAGDAVSTATLRRMVAFFSRHRKNKSGGEDDAGYIAWLLWGGDPGEAWAKRELAKVDSMSKGGPFQPFIDLLVPMLPGWLELPASYAKTLGAALEKGLSHRYIRRVPTGKTTKTGKPRYRYYYHAAHGGTVGNEDHFVVGASFKDDDGHWHITARDGDKITLRHDETGAEQTMSPKALREHLVSLHREAIEGAQARAKSDLADATAAGASAKQVARLKERAARVGAKDDAEAGGARAGFKEGSYTSKKGNLKKVAVFTGRVDSDQFKALAAEAKEHGGSYIRDAGGFVFMGDAGFHAFMGQDAGATQASAPQEPVTVASPAPKAEPAPKPEPARVAPRIAKWTPPAFGSKPSSDTAEAAKNVRADIKAANKAGALPNGLKLSVRTDRYSMGSAIRISIEDAPFQVLNPEKLEREKNDPYTYNGLTILTPEATEIQNRIKAIVNAYNKSYGEDSEGLRNTKFHTDVSYGSDVMRRDRAAFEAGSKPIAPAVRPLQGQAPNRERTEAERTSQAAKLRQTAEKMRADARAEAAKDRQVNTRRRSSIAADILKRADRQAALADAMDKVADAVESGAAPALAGVSSRPQAQVLQNLMHDAHYRSMPYSEWQRTGAESLHPPETVASQVRFPTQDEPKAALARMGITTSHQLYNAVREWIKVTDPKGKRDDIGASKRAEMAEAELMRRGIAGFFPTPKELANRVAIEADIKPGMTVLEPSAGTGRLVDAAKAAGGDVTALEHNYTLQEHLKQKGHALGQGDALSHSGKYDRVVMNPPFEDGQDMDHVRHAFEENLKPGGKLVAIMSEGSFFRSDKKATAFRQWLEANGGTSEKLPSGTFNESGTGVATRLVTVEKAAKAEAPKPEPKASLQPLEPAKGRLHVSAESVLKKWEPRSRMSPQPQYPRIDKAKESQVFKVYGDVGQHAFDAAHGVSSHAKTMVDTYRAARALGYESKRVMIGGNTALVFEKDGRFLTPAGAESIRGGRTYERVMVPKTGDSMKDTTAQAQSDAELISSWTKTLPESTRNHGAAFMAKFNDSPLAEHFTIRPSIFKTSLELVPKNGTGKHFMVPYAEGHAGLIEHIEHYATNPREDWPSQSRAADESRRKPVAKGPFAPLLAVLESC